MKKNIMKTLIGLLLTIYISIPVYANEYDARTNTIFYSNPSITVYADSYQWDKRYDNSTKDYYWICGTPDFHQGYVNAWICTNGNWYYVNNDGRMESDVLVGYKDQKDRYLLGEDGAMKINTYWEQFNSSNYIDKNGLVHLPDIYYTGNQNNLVTVPNLVGLYAESAKYALNNINLPISFVEKETLDQTENNKVLSQSVKDIVVKQGTTITLTVEKYIGK